MNKYCSHQVFHFILILLLFSNIRVFSQIPKTEKFLIDSINIKLDFLLSNRNNAKILDNYLIKLMNIDFTKFNEINTFEVLEKLTTVYQRKGQYDVEKNIYIQWEKLALKNPLFYKLLTEPRKALFSTKFKAGDYEKALILAQKYKSDAFKNKDYYAYIDFLQSEIKVLIQVKKQDLAFKLLKESDSYIAKKTTNEVSADFLRTNGYYYQSISKPNLAILSFEKALTIFEKLKYNNQCALQYLDIGYIYYEDFSDYKNAILFYEKGIKLVDDENVKIRLFDNLGACYWKLNDFKQSLITYQKGFQSIFKDKNTNSIYALPSVIGFKYVKLKQFYLTLIEDKAICWLDYYKATKTKSHLVHALETYELADKLVDCMRQEHTGTFSKYFWRNKTRSLYENAIETCYLLKDYEKAYYFMEKSRAVMLNDKLNELGAKQKLNEADQEKEREYQRKTIELNTKIEAETKSAGKEKLNSQLFDLQEQQERFVKSLETKYPAYYQLKYNTQIGTLKQMQAYLKTNFKGKNATLVSYLIGDSASYAMVISPTKAEVKQFKYNVAQNQEFVNLLATNQGTKADYARILSSGSVIYQKLIKPLNIPKGHLVISQDGVFMPFEALSSSGTNAQYLLNDYAISYTYSGQFLLKKQAETKFWPNQTFVGFAPVEFNNQLNTLKNSDETLGNVAKNYWFSDTFTGKVATKANFLQQAKDHKIVQIFTHAFADSVDTEPKIYFADQSLKISELNAEDQFNTQLLMLSACKTGVGKLAKGEGVLSLARGFSMLGIPATITSLWSVEDKSTYQLTELFYNYLNDGQSKDEALKNAKLEFLKLHPNSSPLEWAGMVLVGETSELSNYSNVYWMLSGVVILSMIGGIFYFRRKKLVA